MISCKNCHPERSEGSALAFLFAIPAENLHFAYALLSVIPVENLLFFIRAPREPGGSRGIHAPEQMLRNEAALAAGLYSQSRKGPRPKALCRSGTPSSPEQVNSVPGCNLEWIDDV
jgi:hypothetical protein